MLRLILAFFGYRRSTDPNPPNNLTGMEEFLDEIDQEKPTRFSSRQLKEITQNFKHVLGEGGFGVVYKGKLKSGVPVAVKVLKEKVLDNIMEKQFKAEVNTLGRIHHFNLVKLYGFCFENGKKSLVYQFVEKGSLADLLFHNRQKTVEWEKLHHIAIGTAKGIAHLHEDCQERVIHHDIKPENILLDRNFRPKVADFGLARLYNRDATHLTPTCFKGTVGYAAPEVFTGLPITCQCDVYSCGMVLFQILGRRDLWFQGENNTKVWLPRFVWNKFEGGQTREMLEDFGIEERNREMAERMVMVALWCAQYQPQRRPRMSSVVKMLDGEIGINPPTDPFKQVGSSRLVFDGSRLQEFGNSSQYATTVTSF